MGPRKTQPEAKYGLPRAGEFTIWPMCSVQLPLSESIIKVRTGRFKSPPLLKAGDTIHVLPGPVPGQMREEHIPMVLSGQADFPFMLKDNCLVLVGTFGNHLGNQEIVFTDDSKRIKELGMAVVEGLRRELEVAEEAHGGFDFLSRRKAEYDELRRGTAWVSSYPIWVNPIAAMDLPKDPKEYAALVRSAIEQSEIAAEKGPEYHDDVQAFHELSERAHTIKDILYTFDWMEYPLFSIVLPGLLESVPPIAAGLEFCRHGDYMNCFYYSLVHTGLALKDESDRKALLIGNRAKVLVGPAVPEEDLRMG